MKTLINWTTKNNGLLSGVMSHGKYEIQPYKHGFMVYYYEAGDPTPCTSDSFRDLDVAKQACEDDNNGRN